MKEIITCLAPDGKIEDTEDVQKLIKIVAKTSIWRPNEQDDEVGRQLQEAGISDSLIQEFAGLLDACSPDQTIKVKVLQLQSAFHAGH